MRSAPRPVRGGRAQRGVAVLVLVAMLCIALPLALAVTWRAPRPEETQRQRSLSALLAAREALLARAVKGRRDSYPAADPPPFRPGALPCPDMDDDGDADGSNCFAYLGRLPFRTLEIDDLRDGAGERLWYALSPAFRPSVYPTSLSVGQLRLQGSTEPVVVLLFAPGPALGIQSRRCQRQLGARDCATLTPSNYLEGRNAHGIESTAPTPEEATFETRTASARTDAGFNDLVLPITAPMFMPAVEARIAREALRCLRSPAILAPAADVIPRAFPAATLWPVRDEPCRGQGPYAYLEAWRPLLRFARSSAGHLLVSAGDATACLGAQDRPC